MPHKLLARRHGTRARVPDLLARLRCEGCRGRPVLAQWVDSAAGGPPSYPPVKRLPLALAWQKGPRAIN